MHWSKPRKPGQPRREPLLTIPEAAVQLGVPEPRIRYRMSTHGRTPGCPAPSDLDTGHRVRRYPKNQLVAYLRATGELKCTEDS